MRANKHAMLKLLALFLALASSLLAQDAIKATTTMHADGSRTEDTINPYERVHTAVTYNAGDKVTRRVVYALDENNLATSATVSDGSGTVIYKAEYKRNFQNLVSEERNFTASGDFIRRLVYSYDTSGQMTRIDTYDIQGQLIDSAGKGIKKKPQRRR